MCKNWSKIIQSMSHNSNWPTSCRVFGMGVNNIFMHCDELLMPAKLHSCRSHVLVVEPVFSINLRAWNFTGGAIETFWLSHAKFHKISNFLPVLMCVQIFMLFQVSLGLQIAIQKTGEKNKKTKLMGSKRVLRIFGAQTLIRTLNALNAKHVLGTSGPHFHCKFGKFLN